MEPLGPPLLPESVPVDIQGWAGLGVPWMLVDWVRLGLGTWMCPRFQGTVRTGPSNEQVVCTHMLELFARATGAEVAASRAGDDVVPEADVVMDRGFDLRAEPSRVWPWIVQLGKGRAGWYLPRAVERVVPRSRRAARVLLPRWQAPAVGDVVPDYGGADATFEVVQVDVPHTLVYRSTRGHTDVSWALTLTQSERGTRVHLRLRLGPVRRVKLAENLGGLFDALTIAGMAAGLRERLRQDREQ